jgi:hypothetical protein
MLCTLAICAQLLLGMSRESEPPNGTWWQADKPHTFNKFGTSYGIAAIGNQFSLSAERMGRMTSFTVACGANEPACKNGSVPYSHWHGQEQPFGAWLSWEPHLDHLFGQIGAGVVWSDFRMTVPDWASTNGNGPKLVRVSNNQRLVSPLAGVGFRTRYVDLLFNWRYVRTTNGKEIPRENFQGLGWSVFNLSVRSRF